MPGGWAESGEDSARASPVVPSVLCMGLDWTGQDRTALTDSAHKHRRTSARDGTPCSRRAAGTCTCGRTCTCVCERTRNPACCPHHSQAWGRAYNRLPRAFLGSPELTLIPTLLLGSTGTCPGLWSRPAGGSGGWALGSGGLIPAKGSADQQGPGAFSESCVPEAQCWTPCLGSWLQGALK